MDHFDKKTINIKWWTFAIIIIIFAYLVTYINQEGSIKISLMIVPITLGIVFESWHLSIGWRKIKFNLIFSLLVSLIIFFPKDNYDFFHQAELWPHTIIIILILKSIMSAEKKKINSRLNEGITLLQTVSIAYWALANNLLNIQKSTLMQIVIWIGIGLASLSLLHSFTHIKLSKKSRLILSIWSAAIMMIFAGLYSLDVYISNDLFDYTLVNMLEYFLLGVSLIYIVKNAMMVLIYLNLPLAIKQPHLYLAYLDETNKEHIERYSGKQNKIVASVLILGLSSAIYYLNHKFNLAESQALIWYILWIGSFCLSKRNNDSTTKTLTNKIQKQ